MPHVAFICLAGLVGWRLIRHHRQLDAAYAALASPPPITGESRSDR
jgi:hypothetical protein